MKKSVKKALGGCIFVAAVIAVICMVRQSGNRNEEIYSRIMSSEYDISNTYADTISYSEYLAGHEPVEETGTQELECKGNEYTEQRLNSLTAMEEDTILTGDSGTISYTFDVDKSGYYNIEIGYFPSADSDKQILRTLYINGTVPFEEAENLVFERMWRDENKNFLMVSDSNQAAPGQEQNPEWNSKKLEAADKMVDGPLMFYLEKGNNVLTLESEQSNMGISYIKLVPTCGMASYQEYLAKLTSQGVEIVQASEIENGAVTVQAEDACYKTSAMLLPQNDRTSPLTVPYDASNIVLNTIGGSSWQDAGMGITWQITVPKSGLYKIATRFMQAENRDFYSVREVKINGEVPFREACRLEFDYDNNFQIDYLGDDENGSYYFYLDEGCNTITFTVSTGDLAYAIEQAQISVKNFNKLYRRFTAVMSSDPDEFRDYNIVSSIPDMVDILETEYYRLNKIMESLGDSMENSTKTRQIAKMALQLEELIEKPDLISLQLSTFNDNVTAISEWMLSLDEQPLELDYISACGEGYELPRADGNFAQNFVHNMKAFIGSFTNDYQIDAGQGAKKDKTIEVWIATSTRDQYDIAQKMVINAFADADFGVELKMVGADTVMPATLTGNGPDVAIQLNYTMPTNFAYRNAGYDLTQFDDFDEVAKQFSDGAMEYFAYEGGYYALPDEMSFPVLYYRKDILEQMGLSVPKTWDELKAMLPYLQAENMSAYFVTTGHTLLGGASSTSTKPVNAVFASMLYQNGEELYKNGDTASNLDSLTSLLTFKTWTEYYTKEDFDLSISVVTRFRTGDTPLIVEDYTYINSILAAAPEIEGQWGIAPIPGTTKEDGTVDNTVCCNVGAAMILKNSVEEKDTANEAWEFLKWWTSEDTQLTYAQEQKSILGDSANFPVANTEAILKMADELGYRDAVDTTLRWARGIPQVPGGYISGRYVENAFLTVEESNVDPVDELYSNVRYINQEITNKRKEFGLTQ